VAWNEWGDVAGGGGIGVGKKVVVKAKTVSPDWKYGTL